MKQAVPRRALRCLISQDCVRRSGLRCPALAAWRDGSIPSAEGTTVACVCAETPAADWADASLPLLAALRAARPPSAHGAQAKPALDAAWRAIRSASVLGVCVCVCVSQCDVDGKAWWWNAWCCSRRSTSSNLPQTVTAIQGGTPATGIASTGIALCPSASQAAVVLYPHDKR